MLTPFTESGNVDFDALDRLVDWYVDAGVAGLFTNSLSGETYELTDAERLRVAERVAERSGEDIPVAASGTFGDSVGEKAALVDRMGDTGVDVVVVIAAQMCEAGESMDVWLERIHDLLDRTDSPLGLYECPNPYHRTLGPESLADVAKTGRFTFFKDTTCSSAAIGAKLDAVEGLPLQLYNANATTLLPTLRQGAAGYAGIAANFYPALVVWLCANHETRPDVAEELARFLTITDRALHHRYPGLAKRYLSRAGLDLTTTCRVDDFAFRELEDRTVDAIFDEAAAWRDRLGIAAPHTVGQ